MKGWKVLLGGEEQGIIGSDQDIELSLFSSSVLVLTDLGFPLPCNLPTKPMSSECPTQSRRKMRGLRFSFLKPAFNWD